jgi:hypothetical protein
MSKKDFELVAEIMSQGLCADGSGEDAFVHTAYSLIHELAWAFEERYPAFKKDVFLKACGVTK